MAIWIVLTAGEVSRKAYNKASLLKGRFGGIVSITGNSRLFKP
jgi:hypothetical protein